MDFIKIMGIFSLTFLILPIYPQTGQLNSDNNISLPDSVNFNYYDELSLNKSSKSDYELNELPLLKEDFLVNTLDGDYGAEQSSINSAMDGNGNYAFTWIDYREGIKQIYVQFFNSNNERIGKNTKVNETSISGNNSPFIAANKNGDFVITWANNLSEVVVQRYKEGLSVGENITINSLMFYNVQLTPSAEVNNDGSFLITWVVSGWDNKSNIYARLFNNSGNPITQEIIINEPEQKVSWGIHTAADGNGNICIVWRSYDNSNNKIYLQIINSKGDKVGNNIFVGSEFSNYLYGISATDDGHFLITWNNNGAWGRIYHYPDGFITDQFLISQNNQMRINDISSDRENNFILLVSDYGNLYFQKINKTGVAEIDTVHINLFPSFSIYDVTITDFIIDGLVLGLSFYSGNNWDIYFRKFNDIFKPSTAFIKINDDIGSAYQNKPLVKFNTNGESIILWEDKRNGRYDLYAQVFDKDFSPKGTNIMVNETNENYWFLNEKIVHYLSDGSFVIAFSGSDEYYTSNIYIQFISTSGEKIGGNILIKKPQSSGYRYKVELNVNENDEILICWYDQYGATFRTYDKKLSPLTAENNFIKYTSPLIFNPFVVSVDKDFNIFTVWRDYNNQGYSTDNKLKGRFFDAKGKAVTEIFIVDSVSSYSFGLNCKNSSLDYIVVYNDYYRTKVKRVYEINKKYSFTNTMYNYGNLQDKINIASFDNQKALVYFISNLDVIGFYFNDNKRKTESYKIHTYDYLSYNYYEHNGNNSADIFDGKLFFAYESNRNGATGLDIWANVRQAEKISFTKEVFFPPASYDILYQNYPNPFNPKTKIAYEILAYHRVKLAVYNVLGQEIKVLIDEPQEKGIYEVEFDATGLASGIYFYKLDAFDTTVKKMIVIK